MIDPKLKYKTVFLTGSNTGIGRETALAFAEQGANIVIHYLDKKPEIEELGVKAMCLDADLMDSNSIPTLFDKSEKEFGKVDILVNNAAHCELPDNISGPSTNRLDDA
jgi:NAD(P)-dependent dehydrogenase (short-subunit alcohol dehydrogenase family)